MSALLKLIDPPDAPRTRLFVVNLFPKAGRIPHDMLAVADRIVEIIFANKMSKDVDIARTVNRFVALIDEIAERHPDIKSLLDRPEYNDLRRYKALDDIVEITNTRDEPVNAASDFSADTIAARIAAGFADADRLLLSHARQPPHSRGKRTPMPDAFSAAHRICPRPAALRVALGERAAPLFRRLPVRRRPLRGERRS